LARTTHRVVERATAARLTLFQPRPRARHETPTSGPPLKPHQECMPPCGSPRRPAPRMRAPANDAGAHKRKNLQRINERVVDRLNLTAKGRQTISRAMDRTATLSRLSSRSRYLR
jgi:Spy/CpxP family protein refolding chaperone